MEKAKRARKVETPKQPSLSLRLRAPYFYPDPARSGAAGDDPEEWGRRARARHSDVAFIMHLTQFEFGKCERKWQPILAAPDQSCR